VVWAKTRSGAIQSHIDGSTALSEAPTPTHLREIPQEWLARWGAKGIPRLLLEELALHLVSLPVPGHEIDVENILKSLPDPKTFSYESSAESTSQLKSIRSTEELYIMAKQQAAKGNRVCADHPFLQLCQRSDTLLTEGFRRAVEAIVDYTPDWRPRQNKKLTPQQIDEITALWINLFQGIDPLAINLLRQYCSVPAAPLGEKPASRRLSPKKHTKDPRSGRVPRTRLDDGSRFLHAPSLVLQSANEVWLSGCMTSTEGALRNVLGPSWNKPFVDGMALRLNAPLAA
jgi:hypothetical protein